MMKQRKHIPTIQPKSKQPFFARSDQRSSFFTKPAIQKTDDEERPLTVSGDAQRNAPEGGIAIQNGNLTWSLRFAGISGTVMNNVITRGTDVTMDATFTPSSRSCPTYSFIQTVRPTNDGLFDKAELLPTREERSGHSIDFLPQESEPYYGAGARAGGGLEAEEDQAIAGAGRGRSRQAVFHDAPVRSTSAIPPGRQLERDFELAVICVESGATMGSVRWGYTKNSNGVIRLRYAQAADVRASSASPQLERVRQAFYSGFFQHSLHSFARGSARLTAAHRRQLNQVAHLSQVRRILLVGSNDYSLGVENSIRLSMRRAEAARDYLVRRGLDTQLIEIQGHGVAARLPNPRGRQVAQNRRVDVRIDSGRVNEASGETGSLREQLRLHRQDPRLTLGSFVDEIFELRRSRGRIPAERCRQLRYMFEALERSQRQDRTIPHVGRIYGDELRSIWRRCRAEMPLDRRAFGDRGPLGGIGSGPDPIERIREDARQRLED